MTDNNEENDESAQLEASVDASDAADTELKSAEIESTEIEAAEIEGKEQEDSPLEAPPSEEVPHTEVPVDNNPVMELGNNTEGHWKTTADGKRVELSSEEWRSELSRLLSKGSKAG